MSSPDETLTAVFDQASPPEIVIRGTTATTEVASVDLQIPDNVIESIGWSSDSRFAFFVLATDKFRALYSVDANSGEGHFEGFRPLDEHWPNGFVLEPAH